MASVVLDNLTTEQKLVVDILVNEGKLQAYEELLEYFNKEYHLTATEDPYYGYYVKYVIELLQERATQLGKDVE
jgi:16S rRNA G527 N7-methylase RsmG